MKIEEFEHERECHKNNVGKNYMRRLFLLIHPYLAILLTRISDLSERIANENSFIHKQV